MPRVAAFVPLLLAAPLASGLVFKDQIGVTDFHYPLVGLPQAETTFFHRPRLDDRASLLYTLSDTGVLAAVHPSSGALVWRQDLGEEEADNSDKERTREAKGSLSAASGADWLAAGRGASVHAWNAATGRTLWWQDFAGAVADVAVVGSAAGDGAGQTDVLALGREAGATVLRRLDGHDGHVIWEQRESRGSGDAVQPLRVHAGGAGSGPAYVVSFLDGGHGGPHGLRVAVVDVQSGKRTEEHTLGVKGGRDELRGAEDVLFVGGSSGAVPPIAVWTDGTRSKVVVHVLGTKQKHEFALPADTGAVFVHALRQSAAAAAATVPLHFVVHTRAADGQSHRAQVFHVDGKTKAVQKAYDLPEQPGAGAFAVTANAAGDGLFITRITAVEVVLVDSAAHNILGSWTVQPALERPRVPHAVAAAVAEVVARPAAKAGDDSYAVRAAVVTQADEWVLLRNGQEAWSRPEGLTGTVAAALADRPESEQLVKALELEAHSNLLSAYIHRLRRHVADLEHLPAYLQSLPQKLLSNIFGSSSGDSSHTPTGPDSFGFHKVAILATKRGRLYGIDAASPGTVLWSTQAVELAPGQAQWAVQRIHVDEALGVATVFAQTAGQSVAVAIETGKLVDTASSPSLRGVPADAEIDSTAVVTSEAGSWVLVVQKGGRVAAEAIPADRCPRETVAVRTADGLQGLRFVQTAGGGDDDKGCVQEATWTFAVPPGFRVVDVAARPAHDPVASIGRVLGDRRVLYKYLNDHAVVVAAVDDAAAQLMTFLVDTVSGAVLASAVHAGVDGSKPVGCLLFENTFVCTFFADYAVDGGARVQGYQLVVSDLYESDEPDRRAGGAVDVAANVSALRPAADEEEGSSILPAVSSQAVVVAARLSALAVTQTRQGITTRQVLAYLPRTHGIVGLPRIGAVLDARRPVGRDPTPAELEEGLGRYAPNLEIDARHVVTHERDVVGIEHIVTAPTHVESTSLVLAFGRVDVFGTRVAPSLAFDLLDQGFGKLSMLGTVAALAVGVAVLRPMVTKKQINLRWQAPL